MDCFFFCFCLGLGEGDVTFFVLFLNESQYYGTQFCGAKNANSTSSDAETQRGMKKKKNKTLRENTPEVIMESMERKGVTVNV